MKLLTRSFDHDYYSEDLDIPPPVGRHDSRVSREKQSLKRMASKARRADIRRVIKEQLAEAGIDD